MSQVALSSPFIEYWDRREKRLARESVYGEGALRFAYETRLGQALGEMVLSKSWFSRLYGSLQDTRRSARKIEPFVRRFGIPMEDYEAREFRSFNEFFIRRFRPGARPFASASDVMPAFCEARYFALATTDASTRMQVKGIDLSPAQLLGDAKRAAPFLGGPVLLARLCPVDYHRFHFPDAGKAIEHLRLTGPLHSVNPMALRFKKDILITNERQHTLLETRNFGKLAYVEVGATCVGRIVQSHDLNRPFERGDEKGYFLFGGSTVVVLGEPGAWTPDADLLEQTRLGRETLVRLGEGIARR